ncbi:MAG: hypothetical protein IKS71_03510 [Bacteroidales bacterium]|nr:hypothetical protein [Bacteroidales bacterium]
MKKFLRMVVVFALAAGASLAYTSCTKDYENEIKDLNTEISALQSTVQGLQNAISSLEGLASTVSGQGGDISGIKTAISQLQSAIDAIKSDYVTEAEAKTIAQNAVAAVKAEVDALKDEFVSKEEYDEAIGELSAMILSLFSLLEMQVVGGVQSIVKLPTDWWGAGVNNMDADRVQAYVLTDGLGNTVAEQSAVILAEFNVTPADAAARLAENAFAYIRLKTVNLPAWAQSLSNLYFLAEIIDYNDEGDIYVKADVSEYFDLWVNQIGPAVLGGAWPAWTNSAYASLIISDTLVVESEDEEEEDVELPLSTVATTFFNIEVPPVATDLFTNYALWDGDQWGAFGGAAPDLEVPYNEYETSERTFGDGLEVLVNGAYTVEEFAELFGVDEALITPTIKITKQAPFTTQGALATAAPKFKYDEAANTIKMDVAKLADAKKQYTNHADVNIELMFGTQVSNAFTQRYVVVEADGGAAVIEGETFEWQGANNTYAKVDDEALVTPENIKVPAAGFNFVPGEGPALPGVGAQPQVAIPVAYLANEHVNLATVNYPANAFRYTTAERKVKLSHDYVDANYVSTNYTMTVTVGKKPANKALDLGTYTGDGSMTNNVTVKLAGVMQKVYDADPTLYAQIPKANNNDTFFDAFADGARGNANAGFVITNVQDETGAYLPAGPGGVGDFAVNFAVASHKDNSTLVITAPTGAFGKKYTITGTLTVFGVTYTYTMRVDLSAFNITLVPTPYVQEGNVIPVTGAIIGGGNYSLDDIHMNKYFELSKETPDNNLTVDFTFKYEFDTKTPANRLAPNGAISTTAMNAIPIAAGDKKIADTGSVLQWQTYDGRTVYGEAQLKQGGVAVGEKIKFTLVTPNPIVSVTGRKTELNRMPGTDVPEFSPADSLDIVTILTDKNEITKANPKAKILPVADYGKYQIVVGWYDAENGFFPFGTGANAIQSLKGKLNGQDFTFNFGTHYTCTSTGKITFLADNAAGDIEVDIPLCIDHYLDYDNGVYNDKNADGYGTYSFEEGKEFVNFHVKIKQL